MTKRKSAQELARIFNKVSREPARQFEKAYGLSGIAGKYRFPKSLPAQKIEDDGYWKEDYESLTKTWKKLTDRNPCLKNIKVTEGSRHDFANAVLGVSSGFNVDDINFFLEMSKKGIPAGKYVSEQPEFKKIYDWIRQATGRDDIFWVPSLPTFKKIKRQLAGQGF